LSHCLIVSLSHCLIVSLSHCLIVSSSHCLIVSLSHCLIVSLSHCLIVSLSHCLIVSLSYCLIVVCLCSPHSCHPFCLSLFIPPVCINHNGNNPMYTCTKYVLNARFCACFVFIPPCIESMHTLFGAYTKRKKNATVLTERPTCK